MSNRRTQQRAQLASERKRQRLLGQLPDLSQILRGSLVTRYRKCGRAGCHCARPGDPGHGPAYYLMVSLGAGKTVQVYVPEQDKEKVQAWLENFQRAKRKLEEISSFNRTLLKAGKLFTRD